MKLNNTRSQLVGIVWALIGGVGIIIGGDHALWIPMYTVGLLNLTIAAMVGNK